MEKQTLLKQFPNQEDKLLVAKVLDKLKFVKNKNQIQCTDFLDGRMQTVVEKVFLIMQEKNYFLNGGYEQAERKIAFMYPEKLQGILQANDKKVLCENIKVISIMLPQELQGTYEHRNYLSAVIKLGIERRKIGDILVNDKGADLLVCSDMAEYLLEHLPNLTRFQKCNIEIKELSDLQIELPKKEELNILVPQLRLDVIVGELAHLSRSKANELICTERVLVNYEIKTKNATILKQGDILTIRGKGKFEIGEIIMQTSKGKLRLQVLKYVS